MSGGLSPLGFGRHASARVQCPLRDELDAAVSNAEKTNYEAHALNEQASVAEHERELA